MNKWVKIENVDLKQLKKRLISQILIPKTVETLNMKFNTNLHNTVNPFILCQRMTKNVPLRNVQYKILHNAYPTMKHLYHWRIKNSPNCASCDLPETTIHALWECNIATQTIQNMHRTLTNIAIGNRQVQISKENFLYGIKSQPVTSMIFTLIKRSLILQREDKNVITVEKIYEMILREYNVEKYIATKQGILNKFNVRWKDFNLINDS